MAQEDALLLPREVLSELVGEIDFDPRELKAKYLSERDRRLRDDGNDQFISAEDESSKYVDDPWTARVEREPLFDHHQVVIVGGGFGGLLMGAHLRQAGFDDIRVIEQGGDFGGTWYWNRYPGAQCDIESYIYLPLLEELGYMPKHKYSFAPEIAEYTRLVARHFGLYEHACLQTAVTGMDWDEAAQRWTIRTDRGDVMTAQFVAYSNAPLSKPKLPGIPGINSYRGHTFHTSRWDYAYTGGDNSGNLTSLGDKRVGIIGTGATAVQCIPHLAEFAEALYVFQRTPSSVDVRNNRETDPEWAASLEPGWQRARIHNYNTLINGGHQDVDLVMDGWTDIFRNLASPAKAEDAARKLGRPLTRAEYKQLLEIADYVKMNRVRARVDEIVEDPAVAEKLKPWYRQFCKRPCFNDEYLPAFNRPNVELVDTAGKGIERVTPNGLVANGIEYELDCIIFATGFEVGSNQTRRMGFDMIGRDGAKLSEHWANGVRTLHGMQVHGFPNCFFLGFTQGAITASVPLTLDEQARHITYILTRLTEHGGSVVECTAGGEQGWVDEMNAKARLGLRFYTECTPGYYNDEGKLGNPNSFWAGRYGGGPIRFMEILSNWRSDGTLDGVELR